MSRILNIFIPVLIALLLIGYMVTFTVRFDQVAVVTTLNKVSSTVEEPGLGFKIPVINRVRFYPKQVQLLEDLLQEQQTKDQFSIVAKLAINWQIVDPEQFYTNVRDIEEARKNIRPLASQLREYISQYRFDELVNTDPNAVKLPELEAQMTQRLQELVTGQAGSAEGTQTDYGIRIERVAIVRLLLPQTTSANVFSAMRERQRTIASTVRQQGENEAKVIINDAQATQTTILAFADTAAESIQNEGRQQAAQYLKVFNENPEFALFLQRLDGLQRALSSQPTFILNAEDLGLGNVLEKTNTSPAAGN